LTESADLLAVTGTDGPPALPTVEQEAKKTAGKINRMPKATALVSPCGIGCKDILSALVDNL
jgi:hypothetical protein